ncbi:hypothetical protein ICW40_16000 [Actinotalea ferrariae]|uniref:hypothetical protein n=1 Tax=Actinotalea ferrariae TaxID=1386098 RepID=UPI001C8BBD79|nr:hypothetical protein [Actinotalea ferrariae]MBX9246300.1 hypothetical protein [Actinotalea ferrariae]
MEPVLLAAHVVAGILFVGPVAVTTSLFPRYAPVAAAPESSGPVPGTAVSSTRTLRAVATWSPPAVGARSVAVAALLHRVTRVYGTLALAVPLIGLMLAAVQGRLGEVWITVAMVLTAVAGGLLALRITPIQQEALDSPDDGTRLRTLRSLAGGFNLLWALVVVLMVVRPGAEA